MHLKLRLIQASFHLKQFLHFLADIISSSWYEAVYSIHDLTFPIVYSIIPRRSISGSLNIAVYNVVGVIVACKKCSLSS